MKTYCRHLFAAALAVATARMATAGETRLPPITGELSGDFQPVEFPSAPKLHWSANFRAAADGGDGRTVDTTVDGEGTQLRAEATLATAERGSWKITASEWEIATWFPAAAEKFGGAMAGLTATGGLTVTGDGLVRAGKTNGVLQVKLRDGTIGNAVAGWKLEGIALEGEFLIEVEGLKVKSTTPFELTVAAITTTRFGARNLFVSGVLNEDHTIALSEAHIEIAGGEIKIDPAMLTLTPLGLETTLQIANVGLLDIAELIPRSFAAAQGRIDGTIRLGWSLAGGFRVGAGNLTLGKSEPAVVLLVPAPGFLTQTMMKRFEPIPKWAGPLSRWLSADNPAYTDMADIELGRAPLEVESLTVRLTPEGDEYGRTATVRMTARPATPDTAVKVVNIDVNVAGPLDSILKLGLNREISVKAH